MNELQIVVVYLGIHTRSQIIMIIIMSLNDNKKILVENVIPVLVIDIYYQIIDIIVESTII